ncbi:MAG: beta-glucosidase [Phycisphaerales bacterium]|nr:beta-glucosidase [Phycisphaerales bacterium]
MSFRNDFLWGVATSAYQIEGAHDQDGRGLTVWDAFCRREGAVFESHHGDRACDHYNRLSEDIALLRWMGVDAYRFSIAWSRVIPEGVGKVSAAGLGFYDKLVDGLLEAGIDPVVTLFHWDYPLALYHRGGWLNRESVSWFGEYVETVVDRLSDRVTRWSTINEPQCFIGLGHQEGRHAPGLKLPPEDHLRAAHHALLAHGRAVQVIRGRSRQPAIIGWAPIGHIFYPDSNSPEDIDAARKATFSVTRRDHWNNTWYSDPVCRGHYPEDGLRLWGEASPRVEPGDMELISQPLDFYGVNIYAGQPVVSDGQGGWTSVAASPGAPRTAFDWLITPESLEWGVRFLSERYRLPVIVTENGMANLDWVDEHGVVSDPQRIDYSKRYLRALARAVDAGADVRGYFHWSLLDNFEWAEGYRMRFGLVHVDFETLVRTPKASAHWYRDLIASRGALLRSPEVGVRAAVPPAVKKAV